MIKIGDTFGRLTVIEQAGSTKQGRRRWKCKCDCGNMVVVQGNHLVSGNTKSCGCLYGFKSLDNNHIHLSVQMLLIPIFVLKDLGKHYKG